MPDLESIAKTEMRTVKAQVTMVAAREPPAVASNVLEVEDEFARYYDGGPAGGGVTMLRPPYVAASLERLCQQNNSLGPCIEAMVVNIDGTGWQIEKTDRDPSEDEELEDDPVVTRLTSFFTFPFPGQSFIDIRKALRRDLEKTGNGFLEVLRNLAGKIVFVRHVSARTVRLAQLDTPTSVPVQIERDGETITIQVMKRDRRFVQLVAGKLMWFREFGATRDLSKSKGYWGTPTREVKPDDRSTELIHVKVGQDSTSPYGVPRWEGQIPSVLGSRSAEEVNLAYFESGGLPPAMIIIHGGQVAEETRQAIEKQFRSGNKYRAAIIEAQSSSGSLDGAGSVKVTVERFDSSRIQDGLFQNYDERCAQRVRGAFRLPPLFLGQAEGYNFATAYTSYLVAEAQVFKPERDAFDSMINRLLLPAMGASGYEFKSKPVNIQDATTQLAAVGMLTGLKGVEPKEILETVNEIAGLNVAWSQEVSDSMDAVEEEQRASQTEIGLAAAENGGGQMNPFGQPSNENAEPNPFAKKKPMGLPRMEGKAAGSALEDTTIFDMAEEAVRATRERDPEAIRVVMAKTMLMPRAQREQFRAALAARMFGDTTVDPVGLGQLAGCTMATLALMQNR